MAEHCWRMWCKALGAKEGSTNKEANTVATIRTLLIMQAITTNMFIIANVILHLPR